MRIEFPGGMEDRAMVTTPVHAEGQRACFINRTDDTEEHFDVIGWVLVFREDLDGDGAALVIDPIIDEPDFGPISATDYIHEQQGWVYLSNVVDVE